MRTGRLGLGQQETVTEVYWSLHPSKPPCLSRKHTQQLSIPNTQY